VNARTPLLLLLLLATAAVAQHESTVKVFATTRVCRGGSCRVEESGGAGVLVGYCARGGLVVTAAHVVRKAESVRVIFSQEQEPRKTTVLPPRNRTDACILLVPGLHGIAHTPWAREVPKIRSKLHTEGYPQGGLTGHWLHNTGWQNWGKDGWYMRFDRRAIGGHSGGPVRDENGHLVTIITNEEANPPCSWGPHPPEIWALFHTEYMKKLLAETTPKTPPSDAQYFSQGCPPAPG
jgi:S1-C subfamily serine protease